VRFNVLVVNAVTLPAFFGVSSNFLFLRLPAPYTIHRPTRRSFSRRFLRALVCLVYLCLIAFSASNGYAQKQDLAKPGIFQTKMDVIAIIWPQDSGSARIAVAYQHRVPHDAVARDLARLRESFKGTVSDLQIDDASLHPDDLKAYPINTAAMFTLSGCSQIVERAPNLMPYITAFQAYDHVEVVFSVATIPHYFGPVDVDTPSVALTLVKEPDDYRYDVTIREHKKDLPALPQNHVETAVATSGGGRSPEAETDKNASQPSRSLSKLMIVVAVALLMPCVVLTVIAVRRSRGVSR